MQTYKIKKTRNGETETFRDRQSSDQIIEFLRHVEKQGLKVNFNTMTAKSDSETYRVEAEQ